MSYAQLASKPSLLGPFSLSTQTPQPLYIHPTQQVQYVPTQAQYGQGHIYPPLQNQILQYYYPPSNGPTLHYNPQPGGPGGPGLLHYPSINSVPQIQQEKKDHVALLTPTYHPLFSLDDDEVELETFGSAKTENGGSSANIENEGSSKAPVSYNKKCLQCGSYYDSSVPAQACYYHPGQYTMKYSSTFLAGVHRGSWTCCRAMGKNDPGCYKGVHKEDPSTTKVQETLDQMLMQARLQQEKQSQHMQMVNKLNNETEKIGMLIDAPLPTDSFQVSSVDPLASLLQSSSTNLILEEEVLPQPPKKNSRFIKHYVKPTDTLVGLSFRYKIKVSTIRQVNRMTVDDVQAYSRLLIPKSESDISTLGEDEFDEETEEVPQTEEEKELFQKRAIQKFLNQTGSTAQEAQFYLAYHGFNFGKAIKELQEDAEWEKQHPFSSYAKKC